MSGLIEARPETTLDLNAHPGFPEVAAALRSANDAIVERWIELLQLTIPSAAGLSAEQLRDNVPNILRKIADSMESASAADMEGVKHHSPAQGLTRFQQKYDTRDLMTEDRLLRRVIVEQVESVLGRAMAQPERTALHMAIDLMLQEAVIAFITQQHDRLRTAAEAELKYLSFLSHDLNNNLGVVTLILQALRLRLAPLPDFAEDVQTLDAAQKSILHTMGGMGRLLQSERLRKGGAEAQRQPVRLNELAAAVVLTLTNEANHKGLKITADVAPDTILQSDGELIRVILQNLAGNAVKYSMQGTVQIHGACDETQCTITVSDEGPGIAAEHLGRIFESFARGEAHLQPGVGLGLTIASQAAKLLGGTLDVQSKVGVGSVFRLVLPQ